MCYSQPTSSNKHKQCEKIPELVVPLNAVFLGFLLSGAQVRLSRRAAVRILRVAPSPVDLATVVCDAKTWRTVTSSSMKLIYEMDQIPR